MLLQRGVWRAAALAQARRACAPTAGGRSGIGGADFGVKAWLSAASGGESSGNDDPTPAETKLAFASTLYGKDPASAAELTPAEEAAASHLRKAAAMAKPAVAPVTSKGHDVRAMFDSSLSQQAEDGKGSGDIKRDVAADTPDATRVAFRASAYGKDPQTAAALSVEEAAEVEALRTRAQRNGAGSTSAAPIHDSRNMFDSDLTHGAGGTQGSDAIKRDVTADTPDATRVAFRASAYGKDPQTAAELSEEEAAEVEALRTSAQRNSTGSAGAAPVHDSRSMFDSDLTHGAGGTQGSDAIKRDVTADTPDATRVAFRASVYGKDPQAAAEHSDEEAADLEALRKETARSGGGAFAAAPVHDARSMFDSDLTHGAGSARESGAIKRNVAADTPEKTRLAFGGSDYGKDPHSMARTASKQAEMDALAARAARKTEAGAAAQAAAPIHDDRSMFDSELTHSSGVERDSGAIKREVTAGTPDTTRLAFKASVYGKDTALAGQHPEDDQLDLKELRRRSQAEGKRAGAAAVPAAAQHAPVHHDRSMFDSDLSQGSGASEEYAAIKRHVETETPALTRLSFFGSTYGDDDPGHENAKDAQELAMKQAKGAKLASVGRGARRSKVHNTKEAMADDVYSQSGSE